MNSYDEFLMKWYSVVGRCCATLFLVSITLFLLGIPGYAVWWFFFSN